MTSRAKRPSKIWQLEPRTPGESLWRFKKWNSKHKHFLIKKYPVSVYKTSKKNDSTPHWATTKT
jgi:hypothetical protein